MRRVLAGSVLLVLAGLATPAVSQEPSPGVVITRVLPGAASARAGLRPGDRLRAWRQDAGGTAAGGAVGSPFDLLDVQVERAPLGEVSLSVERGGTAFEVALAPGDWGIEARPALEGSALAAWGMAVLASSRLEEARALIGRAHSFHEAREPRGAGERRAVSGLAIIESFGGDAPYFWAAFQLVGGWR